jgi:hypothetical protein
VKIRTAFVQGESFMTTIKGETFSFELDFDGDITKIVGISHDDAIRIVDRVAEQALAPNWNWAYAAYNGDVDGPANATVEDEVELPN